jgi:serine/threonine protein phosphatase 1
MDLLEQLFGLIAADDDARSAASVSLVMLGDLVDRGPASRQVIDYLVNRSEGRHALCCLRGNHEEVFLRVLDGHFDAIREWFQFGGRETMLSYDVPEALIDEGSLEAIAHAFADRVPREHIAFLNRMPDHFALGDYLFVHAGIRPGVPLDRQKSADLRWIRREFLDHEGDHGCVVVHGHNIVSEPEELSNRIGIDTGAFASGKLTALGIEGSDRWFLTT